MLVEGSRAAAFKDQAVGPVGQVKIIAELDLLVVACDPFAGAEGENLEDSASHKSDFD